MTRGGVGPILGDIVEGAGWSFLVLFCWTLVVTQVAVIAISVYLHRSLAHRSVSLHPAAEYACRVIIWLTVGVSRQEWVAVHRKHHAFADVPGDPHSPRLYGLRNVWLGNLLFYLREARRPGVLKMWAPDVQPDVWDRVLFSRNLLGLAVGAALLTFAIGWMGLVADMLHGVLNTFVLAPIVNGLAHWQGQQNFENTAYNHRGLAWITGGESLHNNHHAYPRSAKFSMKPGEFDPTWWVIRGLEKARMVSCRSLR